MGPHTEAERLRLKEIRKRWHDLHFAADQLEFAGKHDLAELCRKDSELINAEERRILFSPNEQLTLFSEGDLP